MSHAMVTGAEGMLGTDLCSLLGKSGWRVTSMGLRSPSHYLDITDRAAVKEAVSIYRPDVVFHCAAYTAVDAAEDHEAEAFRVNASGSENVAIACRQAGCKLLAISTDYVFDGTKDTPYLELDKPNPLSVYGRSKLEGEQHIREVCPEHWIVRTAWLFGVHGKCFPNSILARLEQGEGVRVVSDQVGSPTFTVDLAQLLLEIVNRLPFGTYHGVNSGSCSWFEFAREAASLGGHDSQRVQPIATGDWPARATRPAYAVMSSLKCEQALGVKLRPWQSAVAEFVQSRSRVDSAQ